MLAQHRYYELIERKSEWHVEPEQLVSKAVSYQRLLSESRYVYFLIDNDEIVYVGMSDTVQSRLHAHTKDKKFTKVTWMKVKAHDQKYIEAYYIMTLKPKYNKFLPVRIHNK
jgi:transposase